MPWDLLGHVGLLSLWAACGLVPWGVALFVRRGRGAFVSLPVAMVGGIVGGLLVAAFAEGWAGFGVSMLVALVGGTAGMVVEDRAPPLADRFRPVPTDLVDPETLTGTSHQC